MDRSGRQQGEGGGKRLPGEPAPRVVFSVGQLNRNVAGLLQSSFDRIWVAGEISNFTRAASGHCYFTLKDAQASVRAVMFRGAARLVRFPLREGLRVEVFATVGLYEARGDFQLGVEQVREAGAGDLYQQFVQLKARLQAEGLFDAQRKRALPARIERVGVISSPRAAALRDVLTTLRRRAPQVEVILYPASVQGAAAPGELIAALDRANARRECDVLLLVRGGGAIEDLQSFNDEQVARRVAASELVVVCGVGHETDFTICDFVADLRAPTPTAAAVAVSRDRRDTLLALAGLARRLQALQTRAQLGREQRLDLAARRLRSPQQQLADRLDRLDRAARRLGTSLGGVLSARAARLQWLQARLQPPAQAVAARSLADLTRRLARAARQRVERTVVQLDHRAAALALISPRAVLARGYAVVFDAEGRVLHAAADAGVGQPIRIELGAGALQADVTAVEPGPPDRA